MKRYEYELLSDAEAERLGLPFAAWDTPQASAGQIVEVSYSDGYKGGSRGRTPCDYGDLYRMSIDLSDRHPRRPTYAKRIGPSPWATK